MAKSETVEKEILTAVKIRQNEGEPRPKFLARVTRLLAAPEKKWQDIWESLSEPAQLWVNDAVDALEAGKPIQEFSEIGGTGPSDAEEEEEVAKTKTAPDPDEDEDEAPKKSKKAKAAEDEDEEEKPAKKAKAKPADDEDEDEAPKKKAKAKADDDNEDAPKKKKAKADEDEDEKPAKKKKAKDDDGGGRSGPDGIKYKIKAFLIENADADVDAVVAAMKKAKVETSDGTVRSVRSEFRHTMRVLKDHNQLRKS